MSAEKLAKVGEIMNGFIKDKKIAGGIVLIARNGKVVFEETYGLRDRERNLPVERDTIFRIYSMSKAITSAAALILVDEGKLDLDAPVSKYLPEFADVTVFDGDKPRPAKSPITVKDLVPPHLGHHLRQPGRQRDGKTVRSGRRARHAIRPAADGDQARPACRSNSIPAPSGNTAHRSTCSGSWCKKSQASRWRRFLHERIFEPLSMTDTAFYVPAEKQSRFAANYYTDGKGQTIIRDDPARSGYLRKPGLSSGGGGLVGTASDYMRFLLMIENDGEWNGTADSLAESVELMRHQPAPQGRRLDRLRRRPAQGRRLRPGLFGDRRAGRQDGRQPQGRIRLGRRRQHPLLGLAARQSHRRHDGTTLAVFAGDGRDAQAGDLRGH